MLIRSYTLTFGEAISVTTDDFTDYGGFNGWRLDLDNYVAPGINAAYQIDEHNISFSISKSGESTSPNNATITINNLSENLANYLYQNQNKSLTLILKAGYEDTVVKEIFRGTISGVTDTRRGNDRITRLSVSDGGFNMKETTTSRVYARGTRIDTIITDLMTDLGLSKDAGAIATFGSSVVTESTYSVYGTPTSELKRLGDRYKTAFSVQDQLINFVPVDARVAEQVAYVSEDTGLINSPQAINTSGASQQGDSVNNNPSIQFETLLNGDLLPNKTVYLKSNNYDLALKITKVTHTGEYEGTNWKTTVIGTEVPYVLSYSEDFVRN